MISCAEAEEFIVEYLDGELARSKRKVFERHLKMCADCRQYLDAYQTSIALGKAAFAAPDAAAIEAMPEELVQAILDARRH